MILILGNMKRIIYSAAIAALLVTSCQKTDVLNVVEDTIAFGTEVGKLTKSEDYTLEKYKTLIDQGFRVWVVSDFTSAPHTDGDIYNDMDGLDVEYKDGWAFVNKGKYMWPQSGQYLYFYAISSDKDTWLDDIKEANYFITEKGANSVSQLTLPEYTVGEKEDPSVADDDIMVANHIHQHKGTMSAKTTLVKPNFRHTMTKVEFNFKKGSPTTNASTVATTVVLKKVEISPVTNVGKLNVTYGETAVEFGWTPTDNAKKSFIYNALEDAYFMSGEDIVFVPAYKEKPEVAAEGLYCKVNDKVYLSKKVTSDDSVTYEWEEANVQTTKYTGKVLEATSDYTNHVTWYMIPQDLNETQIVTITYEADGKPITQNFALTVDGSAKDWTEETCVKYNVTITPHKIVFKPSVDPWVNNPDIDMNL